MPSATVSTADPNAELNVIPYNVGEMTGLPAGWRVEVERVKRTSTVAGLPAPGSGLDYVTVDVRVMNDEGPNVRFDAAALFQLYDEGNNEHHSGLPSRATPTHSTGPSHAAPTASGSSCSRCRCTRGCS